MLYKCPLCGVIVPGWIAKREQFECPECKTPLTSNSKKTFRRSLVVALISWLTLLLSLQQYSGSWAFAAAASIEAGGMLSAMVAALYYHIVIDITVEDKEPHT